MLPDLTPHHFAWDPMLESVKRAIEPGDAELVRTLVQGDQTLMWGALLSRGLLEDDELTDVLLDAFQRERDDERSIGLLHHVTARRLDDDQYAVIARWLSGNAALLIADQQPKFDDDSGKDRLLERLTSDEWGYENKRCLYMYSLHSLGRDKARELLQGYVTDGDPRVAEAARHSLSLLG